MVRFNRERRAGILAIGCLFVVPVAAHGQVIGMLQDERAVTACFPGYEDYRNGTGVIYGGATPSTTPLNFSYSYGAGSPDHTDISQSASADYGMLTESTSGDAQSGGGDGCFTWSSTFWGGDVVVGFTDYIIPTEDMSVEFQYTVSGQSSFQSNVDGGTDANVTTAYSFNSVSGGLNDFALNGAESYTGVTQLTAGQEYQLFAGLGWDCSANSNDSASRFSSYEMSAVGDVTLTSLTPGASFRSLSGHNYAVPEPSSLWVLGIGALGFLRRKRK